MVIGTVGQAGANYRVRESHVPIAEAGGAVASKSIGTCFAFSVAWRLAALPSGSALASSRLTEAVCALARSSLISRSLLS